MAVGGFLRGLLGHLAVDGGRTRPAAEEEDAADQDEKRNDQRGAQTLAALLFLLALGMLLQLFRVRGRGRLLGERIGLFRDEAALRLLVDIAAAVIVGDEAAEPDTVFFLIDGTVLHACTSRRNHSSARTEFSCGSRPSARISSSPISRPRIMAARRSS